jgi:hypothetical protein
MLLVAGCGAMPLGVDGGVMLPQEGDGVMPFREGDDVMLFREDGGRCR